jgi:hypothetical protein
MTFAIVKVFPEPVTPSRTWCSSPLSRHPASCEIAEPWSPRGSYVDESRNNIDLRDGAP